MDQFHYYSKEKKKVPKKDFASDKSQKSKNPKGLYNITPGNLIMGQKKKDTNGKGRKSNYL